MVSSRAGDLHFISFQFFCFLLCLVFCCLPPVQLQLEPATSDDEKGDVIAPFTLLTAVIQGSLEIMVLVSSVQSSFLFIYFFLTGVPAFDHLQLEEPTDQYFSILWPCHILYKAPKSVLTTHKHYQNEGKFGCNRMYEHLRTTYAFPYDLLISWLETTSSFGDNLFDDKEVMLCSICRNSREFR